MSGRLWVVLFLAAVVMAFVWGLYEAGVELPIFSGSPAGVGLILVVILVGGLFAIFRMGRPD